MPLFATNKLAATPITAAELRSNLAPLWNRLAAQTNGTNPARIGVCVSGGADSMVLAVLLRQIQAERLSLPLDLTAFIVDHQARRGSAEEARNVADTLGRYGVQSEILKINWPSAVEPSSLPNFETQARTNRYRTLAHPSIRAGIDHLLLGHHQDDQIETILLRLMRATTLSLSSLQGLPYETNIPCCSDIFHTTQSIGISQERYHRSLPDTTYTGNLGLTKPKIWIHRPLLDIPKTRILATCEANNIAFVSDQTNFDPTVTKRNAVRYMRSNYNLPRALQDSAVLSLRQKAVERMELARKEADVIFHAAEVLSLDFKSRVAMIRIPQNLEELSLRNPRDAAVLFMKRLVQAIYPPDEDQQRTEVTDTMLSFLFPSPSPPGSRPKAFTCGRVWLEPQHGNTWRLSRRPFQLEEIEESKTKLEKDPNAVGWSKWVLYDGRYWIRVCAPAPAYLRSLVIRPYTEEDTRYVHLRLADCSHKEQRRIRDTIKQSAPGKIRWTLPVIADDRGVLAFPTLDIPVSFRRGRLEVQDWEVRLRTLGQLEFFQVAERSLEKSKKT